MRYIDKYIIILRLVYLLKNKFEGYFLFSSSRIVGNFFKTNSKFFYLVVVVVELLEIFENKFEGYYYFLFSSNSNSNSSRIVGK